MMIYLQTIDTAEDRSKFEQLYEQYKQLMFYTAFQILKRPQDAEDAVHLAFLSIAENISRISDLDCPKTRAYIVTIVERKQSICSGQSGGTHPCRWMNQSTAFLWNTVETTRWQRQFWHCRLPIVSAFS
ncbi:MAG: sigma factor [Oscillospiraceae bacterium]